jgi:hypothetical protein
MDAKEMVMCKCECLNVVDSARLRAADGAPPRCERCGSDLRKFRVRKVLVSTGEPEN